MTCFGRGFCHANGAPMVSWSTKHKWQQRTRKTAGPQIGAAARMAAWRVYISELARSGGCDLQAASHHSENHAELFFEMMIFRNSIRNGTEFYYQ